MNVSAYMYLEDGTVENVYNLMNKMSVETVWELIMKKVALQADIKEISLQTSLYNVGRDKPIIFKTSNYAEVGNSSCACSAVYTETGNSSDFNEFSLNYPTDRMFDGYRVEVNTVAVSKDLDEFSRLWKKHGQMAGSFATKANLVMGRLIVNPRYRVAQWVTNLLEKFLPDPIFVIEETEI